jgi:hypothetical protein
MSFAFSQAWARSDAHSLMREEASIREIPNISTRRVFTRRGAGSAVNYCCRYSGSRASTETGGGGGGMKTDNLPPAEVRSFMKTVQP